MYMQELVKYKKQTLCTEAIVHTHREHLQCQQMLLDKDVLQLLYLSISLEKKEKKENNYKQILLECIFTFH